jgi:leader peptidase (prepilin peptidase) / N-methyltransferase
MDWVGVLLVVLVFFLGASLGSFGNVVAFRVPLGRSVVRPGSSCGSCGRRLGLLDLVPVLSWLWLRGRCGSCGVRFGVRYLLVEVVFGLSFVVWGVLVRPDLGGGWLWFLLGGLGWFFLLVAALVDWDSLVLPDGLLGLGLLSGLVGLWVSGGGVWGGLVVGLLGAGGLFLFERFGALWLRGGGDTRDRFVGFGFDHVLWGLLVGVVFGGWWGVGGGLGLWLLGRVLGRLVRLSEVWVLLGVVVVLLVGWWGGGGFVGSVGGGGLVGGLFAGGVLVLFGGVWWWVLERLGVGLPEGDGVDPVAVGFGDVKLMVPLGVLVGDVWVLVLGFFVGNVLGLLLALVWRRRVIPFGPSLVLGVLLGGLFAGGVGGLLGF